MNMCLIYKLILLILVFILLIVYDKHKEEFVIDVGNRRYQNDRQGHLGPFSVVDVGDGPDALPAHLAVEGEALLVNELVLFEVLWIEKSFLADRAALVVCFFL